MLVCGALLFSLASPADAPQQSDPHALPVVVNGAVNPELIPDDIAYRHFFKVLMDADDTPRGRSRTMVLLGRLHFSAADSNRFVGQLNNARASIVEARKLVQRPDSNIGPVQTAEALRQQYIALLDALSDSARRAISAGAALSLHEYIRGDVKRRIVIYGSMPPY
jgi:hypothetical protein